MSDSPKNPYWENTYWTAILTPLQCLEFLKLMQETSNQTYIKWNYHKLDAGVNFEIEIRPARMIDYCVVNNMFSNKHSLVYKNGWGEIFEKILLKKN